MKNLFFLFFFTMFLSFANGQGCQTIDGGIYYNNNYKNSFTGSLSEPILIKLYIWRVDTGNGFPSDQRIKDAQNGISQYYNSINIYFDYCIGDWTGDLSNINLAYLNNSKDDGLNLYLADSWPGGIAEVGSLNALSTSWDPPTMAHELGHCLGLLHTFAGATCPASSNSELTPTLNALGEYVNSPNCSTHGDLICDTPADPAEGYNECFDNGQCTWQNLDNITDFVGNVYIDPFNTVVRNIMSYTNCTLYEFTSGQNERIRDMIAGAPILSNITRVYQPNLIYSPIFTYPNNTISSDEIWSENTSFDYDITVDEGIELTISADIKFTQGHGLHIKKGGQLIIDGGTLDLDLIREPCEASTILTWKGVSIDTNDATQSVLEMYNDAEINNADVALDIKGQGSIFFFINHSEFKNNRISIQASNNSFAQPYIRNTDFKLESGYLPTSEYGQIILENCNRIYLGSCNFFKSVSNSYTSSGVISFNTGITCINCNYSGWSDAANLQSANDKTAYFSASDFSANNTGIYIENFRNSLIRNTDFFIGDTPYSGDNYGINVSRARGTRIYDNMFEGVQGNESHIGVYSFNYFFNVLYNNNVLNDLDIAYESLAVGNSQAGLNYECNVFEDNEIDVDATSGMKIHGSSQKAIGNEFSHNNNGNPGSDFTVSDFAFDYNYFYNSNSPSETPMFVDGFEETGILLDSECDYPNIVNNPPTTGTLTPFHVKHTEFTNGINNTNNHIDTNADNGDTDGLVVIVNTDSPNNPGQVYNNLINISPWVSVSVGQAVISNSQYYTESQLVSLFIANSYWLQDEVLYAFVNGPSSPLSSFSIAYINNNTSSVDAQSQAFFYLSDLMHGRDVNITNAINFINTVDDSSVNYNDLRTWFDMMDGYHKEISISESYMTQHDYISATSHLSQKGSATIYSISERNDINEYLNILNIQISVYTDKRNEWNLTSSEYTAIEIIANSIHPIASAKAQDILEYYYGVSFPKSKTRNNEMTSYKIAKESTKTISVYPNPTSNSFNIEGVEDYLDMDLQISNIYGDLISTEKVSGVPIIQNLESGLYIITIINSGRQVAAGKVIIIK